MLYNVLHGFHTTAAPFTLETERLRMAQRLVHRASPDILALNEACYGGANPYGVNVNYKGLFRYPYASFVRWGTHEWGNMLLSRFPLRAVSMPLLNRTALRAYIDVRDASICLDLLHFDPRADPPAKVQSLKNLIPHEPRTYILAGDFNAVSPLDHYDEQTLTKGFTRLIGSPRPAAAYTHALLDPSPITTVLGRGLVDAYTSSTRRQEPTVPTRLVKQGYETDARVDFIFCSPDIGVRSARIINTATADAASDHYPVFAQFSV